MVADEVKTSPSHGGVLTEWLWFADKVKTHFSITRWSTDRVAMVCRQGEDALPHHTVEY